MTTDGTYDLPAPGEHDPLDEDLAPLDLPGGEGSTTALAELKAELDELIVDNKTWPNPNRPGWAATFRTDIDDKQFRHLQRRSQIRGQKDARGELRVDELKLSLLMLGTYNVGITVRGTSLTDNDGDPMTFRSTEWLTEVIDRPDVAAGVRKYYGTDGAVISAGRALMQASGYLDDPDEVDDDEELLSPGPTKG